MDGLVLIGWPVMRPDEPLAILWDDPHLLAVIKPAGLLTQGVAGGEPTLEDAVRRFLRPDDPGSVYLGTIHRLDRPVSGVIVWARTPKAARRVADQFARGEARKEYWAVVEGGPATAEERWDDWLGPVDASGVARVVSEGSPGARRAITRARSIAGARCPAGMGFLALDPETGRTHQLRAQSAARRRPIAGDLAYGSTFAFPRGIALHARRLSFAHPVSRRAVTLVAPLPEAWASAGMAPPST
jgi:23S rRNA pseudouridine1911/1915/1917 synthase